MKKDFPILEFDPSRQAIIEPAYDVSPAEAPEHCVLCFHREVVEKIKEDYNATVIKSLEWESGDHQLYGIELDGQALAFLQPGVGAPLAASLLEACIAMGSRKFIACGGAGVLDRNIPPAHVIVPTAAVRDEGTSYHYLEPGREVTPSAEAVVAIEATLKAHGIPHLKGKTWTTDAPYRETTGLVKQRRGEGCITVEMEAAALFAVAAFRSVKLGQLLYGGDDVSGEKWATRDWKSRASIREKLFWLAAEACLKM